MHVVSDEIGAELVRLARRAVELSFEEKLVKLEDKLCGNASGVLAEKMGIFVTIHTYPEKELRGCIGIPYPLKELCKAVVSSAISAAFEDPRFPPLRRDELEKVVFEVSVLTPPERIEYSNPDELLEKIVPFVDGLILEVGDARGLFLPQVWEQLPDKETFLSHLCLKAGLWDTSCWKRKDAKIYRFRVEAFEEEEPCGTIRRVQLGKAR